MQPASSVRFCLYSGVDISVARAMHAVRLEGIFGVRYLINRDQRPLQRTGGNHSREFRILGGELTGAFYD